MTRLRLGLLAGEASGDNLGAGLMRALSQQLIQSSDGSVQIEYVGVGGEHMLAAGLHSLAPMDKLAVNGFAEPIVKLPSLVRLYRQLVDGFSSAKIDGFVGVDFNVFNFLLESALRKRGVLTTHYVSPSVYAWRAGRTKRVAKCANLILCLYPFEPAFYQGLSIDAQFVGHPLADEITPDAGNEVAKQQARQALDLVDVKRVLAVLPGSRAGEVKLMMPEFLAAAQQFCRKYKGTAVVIPCVRPELRDIMESYLGAYPELDVKIYDGNARLPLTACDLGLIKSGTSTLEAMLLHRPMVVSYRMGRWSYQLARRLLRSPFIALPNILAQQELVPELLQYDASADNLFAALDQQLQRARSDVDFTASFVRLHQQLRQGADIKAAAAVLQLLGRVDEKS